MRTPLLLAAILVVGFGLWFLSPGLEQAGPGGVDLNRMHDESGSPAVREPETVAVSYTHLTLPTIYSV